MNKSNKRQKLANKEFYNFTGLSKGGDWTVQTCIGALDNTLEVGRLKICFQADMYLTAQFSVGRIGEGQLRRADAWLAHEGVCR